jgi:hypothetical protein
VEELANHRRVTTLQTHNRSGNHSEVKNGSSPSHPKADLKHYDGQRQRLKTTAATFHLPFPET